MMNRVATSQAENDESLLKNGPLVRVTKRKHTHTHTCGKSNQRSEEEEEEEEEKASNRPTLTTRRLFFMHDSTLMKMTC